MLTTEIIDGVRVVRFNAPPLNTITLELLSQLRSAVQQANQDDTVQGLVITGDETVFSAGADIHLFKQVASSEDAIRLCQLFQSAFQEIEDCSKPVIAALAGTVIGGALELAMACHFRIASTDSRFTMPEIRLGILPGAGGTQRLPRLVGPAKALKMLLTAETIQAERALDLGLVDQICPADQLLRRACDLARTSPGPKRTSQQEVLFRDSATCEAVVQEAETLIRSIRPEIIAPQRIIAAVRAGWEESFAAGLLQEQHGFDSCMQTHATRNKIYLFFATRETSKVPELAGIESPPLAHAAVIGMGSMGTDIATALILSGVRATVLDQSKEALDRGIDKIRRSIHSRVKKGRLSSSRAEQTLGRLSTTTRWEDVAANELVIESVFEDVEVKRTVIKRLEDICPSSTILATNTSTIPLDELVVTMKQPHRLIGMHFFNPAHRMPLLEIVRRECTPPEILAAVMSWSKTLRKTPVLVASRVGFLVNRLFVPYVQEAFELLEEGATAAAIDRCAVEFGFPMGPLALMDMTGLDILTDSQRVLASAVRRHGSLSPIATSLVERGQLGQKTSAGIYRYESGSHLPLECDATARIIAEVQQQRDRTARMIDPREIQERLVLRMACEAFYVLEERVARSQADVDVATVLGTGFPDFRGGVLKYVQNHGISQIRDRLGELTEQYGERFSPSNFMQQLEGVS
jgi:3-hydroxyacyl-CoA dehydrogenase